jgi:hypothetical protein
VNVAPTNVAGINEQAYQDIAGPAKDYAALQEQYRQAQLGALASIAGSVAGGAARGYFGKA